MAGKPFWQAGDKCMACRSQNRSPIRLDRRKDLRCLDGLGSTKPIAQGVSNKLLVSWYGLVFELNKQKELQLWKHCRFFLFMQYKAVVMFI